MRQIFSYCLACGILLSVRCAPSELRSSDGPIRSVSETGRDLATLAVEHLRVAPVDASAPSRGAAGLGCWGVSEEMPAAAPRLVRPRGPSVAADVEAHGRARGPGAVAVTCGGECAR